MEEKIKQWNMVAIGVFALLAVWAFRCLEIRGASAYLSIGDFVIISLAVLRVIRLVAYDNITLFLREAFLDVKTVSLAPGGEEFVERVPSENSFKRTIAKLLNCPWCIGVWATLVVMYLYLAYPGLWIAFVLLAISSVASILQLITNLLGWRAEHAKIATTKLIED